MPVNGDGTSVVFDSDAGAIQDVGKNPSRERVGIAVIEIPDVTKPVAIRATLNYSYGDLIVTISESLDLMPTTLIDLDMISLAK